MNSVEALGKILKLATGESEVTLPNHMSVAQGNQIIAEILKVLDPIDIFPLATQKVYNDVNVPDPEDLYSAATLNTAGWTHA